MRVPVSTSMLDLTLLQPLLELAYPAFQAGLVAVLVALLDAAHERVVLPPGDAHLARPVDGGDHQPDLDRQQLDVEQPDLDVTDDHDALVEHPLEDIGEVLGRGFAAPVEDRPLRGVRVRSARGHRSSTW